MAAVDPFRPGRNHDITRLRLWPAAPGCRGSSTASTPTGFVSAPRPLKAPRDLLGAARDQEGFRGCRGQGTRQGVDLLGHGRESTCPKGPTFWSAEEHRRLANRPPGRLLLKEVARLTGNPPAVTASLGRITSNTGAVGTVAPGPSRSCFARNSSEVFDLSMANCQIGLSAVVLEVLIPLPECATSLSYSFI